MPKHRAVIIGAGRIGAGYNWDQDLGYTHAGAYMALKDRVELVGFVEPDEKRGMAAFKKWGVPFTWNTREAIDTWKPDIVSVCTPHEMHASNFVNVLYDGLKGVWMEKPFEIAPCHDGNPTFPIPVQVNYQRRADPQHQMLASFPDHLRKYLVVYGKDDETTRCHFRDLARWWKVPLDYRPRDGPCAYAILLAEGSNIFFDNGGVDSAECFKGMLGNLLDAVEGKAELWSPPYVEEK